MTTAYRIRDWSKHFENNRTRELKELRFVILPNKHDGDGYTELLDHPNGAAHYGAWVAMVQVASKCDPRGTLVRDGARPHDPASLSRLTRLPEKVFKEALPRLVEIGWLETYPVENHIDRTIPQEGATLSAAVSRTPLPKSALEQNGIEEKGIEEKEERESRGKPALVRQVFEFWKTEMNHPRAQLTADRKKKIEERLSDSTVDEILTAIRGCKASDFHMGREPGHPDKFDDIELICRKRSKLEFFIGKAPPETNGKPKRVETIRERSARESCERCFGTGTEAIPGKGGRACDHAATTNIGSSEGVEGASSDSRAGVS